MELIKFTCQNSSCQGHTFSYKGLSICPLCNTEMNPDFSVVNNEVLNNALINFPAHLATPIFQLFSTPSYYKRLHYMSDALIGGMRLSGNLLISIYLQSNNTDEALDDLLAKISTHETHGGWSDIISKLYNHLESTASSDFTNQYIPLLGKSSKTIKKEKSLSVENTFTDEYGKLQKKKLEGTPMQLLINFRNKYLGHGAVISEQESKEIYEIYYPIFTKFIQHLSFIGTYNWKANKTTAILGWNTNSIEIETITADKGNEKYVLSNKFPIQFIALNNVNNGNYRCNNPVCIIYKKEIGLPIAQSCPSCGDMLSINESELTDDQDEIIINEYPYLIAFPYYRAILEQDPYKKIHLLKETFLNYLKYMGLLVASEYFKSDKKIKSLNTNFRELLYRPQFGYWNKYIRESIQTMNENEHQWFIKELPEYYNLIETEVFAKEDTKETPIGRLINFRNIYLGHGMVPSDEECRALWNTYSPVLKKLLLQMDFCKNYSMVSYDNLRTWRLMGTEFTPLQNTVKNSVEDRVQILNEKGEGMNLVPFFVLPGEYFRQETSSRAKLMVYEQNTGKRIVFFSPESVTDETSGEVLERLKLLLSEKDNEEAFTVETLTNDVFMASLNYRNVEMHRTLMKERKVIDGVYQAREEAEVALRSWIGARAGLFFIAADAGSGKTNLLNEMSRQYKEREIPNLIIRANRMVSDDIWQELKYQLNLESNFEIKKSEVFKQFQQENPFIILIDGGNEHPRPEKLLTGILDFLEKNKGGHIKIVLSWRVNTKSEIPNIDTKFEHVVYADNNEEGEENILAKYCHWLKPLNKKELEGAWNFYVTKNTKTHKPQFSLEDLTYHDRALTDQLHNPLMLRLFLELFHNKNLPKNKKFINIWSMYHEKLILD
jgi:hypothetical protein